MKTFKSKIPVIQSSRCILMAKPLGFGFNDQTAQDNVFMHEDRIISKMEIRKKAIEEWENFGNTLKDNGIEVITYDDTQFPEKPDAVFCRDWNSFHDDGTVILYPLKCKNRREERRPDVIEKISKDYYIKEIISLAEEAENGKFLEGSGAIVFDHVNKRMYACKSQRTNPELVERVSNKLGFKAYIFEAKDKNHIPIYHADVVVSLGSEWAVLCEESFEDPNQMLMIRESLEETGHKVVSFSMQQLGCFAGNCYEAINDKGEKLIVLSKTGYDSYSNEQKAILEIYAKFLPIDIHTIEYFGGGSARCISGDIRVPKLEKTDV